MKLFTLFGGVLLLVGSAGCNTTPVTFAPYVGYGDAQGIGPSWQVGLGASFTLGGPGLPYVTPVPAHPPLLNPGQQVDVVQQTQSQNQVQNTGN